MVRLLSVQSASCLSVISVLDPQLVDSAFQGLAHAAESRFDGGLATPAPCIFLTNHVIRIPNLMLEGRIGSRLPRICNLDDGLSLAASVCEAQMRDIRASEGRVNLTLKILLRQIQTCPYAHLQVHLTDMTTKKIQDCPPRISRLR